MKSRILFFSLLLMLLGLNSISATPIHNAEKNSIATSELIEQEAILKQALSVEEVKINQKEKKGFFSRIGQNFMVKKVKKIIAKQTGQTVISSDLSHPTNFANADDQELKDAYLIGMLLGFLLGLLGLLVIALAFKAGPRKKKAFKGALIGLAIIVALVLIISVI